MDKQNIFNNIRVVLCQTSHPGNIGSTARAMKTMGLSDLYLVNPLHFPDPQATSLATGAADLLESATVCSSLQEALTGCALAIGMSARKRQISHELVNVREAAHRAASLAQNQPIALVFGTEMSGLSNAELDCCQLLAMIPANPEYSSLNLAAAVQVMTYEVRMAILEGKLDAADNQPELATNEALEGFYAHLEDTLIKIGYLNPTAPKKLSERIRRIYARAKLEKEEVNLLRGILTLSVTPKKHQKY
ncbi:tRNA (cytosine(32)/uridine(32)-2'-O)-methyltransferase TrmJ [Methylotenera oryzisoli]|uniref:tRNA (cytidine/uridine-2'-O-)-methyltransferase TrmJ n=1 Tax=Methylotenera oryzisoli TaxID=2080758 RepID=A0A4Y9VPY5_9PROT|nr:RNA methyltransferase [Methylotenera oryzisoli]TFW70557.1 tRNA (cytosine(32)/uridine(32)-2'-O)-methyltransferase TrmJ [Methylotenera oryzisoli]